MIVFTIPGDPIAQGRPRAYRQGKQIKMYDPKESKDYKRFVELIAKQHAPKKLLEGAIKANIHFYRPIPKRTSKKDRALISEGNKHPVTKPDTSNYVKGIEDALNGIIYKDDSQITQLSAGKSYSDNPRVEIEIQEINLLEVGG